MDCEVLAIGTELLLGQIVDTNSAWIGEQLAAAGISCYQQTKVGDNHDRIVAALRAALARGSEVICCGGLGPTQDDITREAIAEVMGVPLRRDPDLVARLNERFAGREIPAINYKQADLPVGASPIASVGTAPGLVCPVGDHLIYAVPGVPSEMREMLTSAVLPDIVRRSGQRAAIRSRFLRVWGMTESKVAEVVTPRVEALDTPGADVTIAFLASATEGIRVRMTARATGDDAEKAALAALDKEEAELRALLGEAVGGVDDEGIEVVVGGLLVEAGLRLAVAESLTGGLVAARVTSVAGASNWFAGGIVSYGEDVKRSLLDVGPGPVVSEQAASEMALGVKSLLNADIGLSLTGVAGPTEQDGQPVGTVFVGLAGAVANSHDGRAEVAQLALRGERRVIRERAGTYALDLLRRRLIERS
ncbi:MAG TPA: CinA family nicotinamide mononucleotide deamidase-related protein [Acidimicrobiales bacterium]|nr:CinA family nicotinamide mononucleotide deamidase-related protein [Acidimicrobiales bacterium]